jgi:hypothetical protein
MTAAAFVGSRLAMKDHVIARNDVTKQSRSVRRGRAGIATAFLRSRLAMKTTAFLRSHFA